MLNEALKAVEEYRNVLNSNDVNEVNKWISKDFIGYFGYYNDRDYEVYTGASYKLSNVETFESYQGKNPQWQYTDLTSNLRSENEIILSSIIDFYFSGKKVASALAIEIFKKEQEGWKLYRQHMERYSSS
ncbi:DUF4440 domain-containing protein [Mesobacillus subterraneus]|uniref:DUF4440 domain-containing protein n=1 Tax=Mesobacillus subterraneus TaxID=285983 RepID=UPI00203BDAFE|nr:DUF4440 domain-containing protein [Mesobacillus subterraneus]MCM3575356.1 DUF4440 domain-containing protein [Mesobacillus subterraneus]